jgi:hypothetical protein
MRPLHNSHFLREDGHFLQFQGSRAGFLKQLIYGGFLTPSAFSSLKLGAAVSPVDKLLKDGALPPVASEKPTLSSMVLSFSKDFRQTKIKTQNTRRVINV